MQHALAILRPCTVTSAQLWDALQRLALEDGTADRISPSVIAKLIEFKMVTLDKAGLPQLTDYGQKCYSMYETGDDSMTPIDDLADAMKHPHSRARARQARVDF